MKQLWMMLLIGVSYTTTLTAQEYKPKVSKDSVGVLNARIEALKASAKVQELKIKEAEEETDVEKLRLKLLEANDVAKISAAQNNELTEKLKSGAVDAKSAEKIVKKAKTDASDAQKALDRYNKQIAKVEEVRTQIQIEERKLTYKKPQIIYGYK